MNIGIFTHYPLDPIHPRTEMIRDLLREAGHHPEVHNLSSTRLSLKTKLILGFFDLDGVKKAGQLLEQYDMIIIQGMKFLPLAGKARKQHKPVIYETLDKNVHLRMNQLIRKSGWFRILFFYSYIFTVLERNIAFKNADSIVVNSLHLQKYFRNRARLIYYSSPFEGLKQQSTNPPAFFHLGALTIDKGADEILGLVDKFSLPCFIYGRIQEDSIRSGVSSRPGMNVYDRLSADELMAQLTEIMKKYSLLGLSLIRQVHKSYVTGEANKEIDYLAMGIPFIGNYRIVTRKKIDAGCGMYFDDQEGINRMLNDAELRQEYSQNCLNYYHEYFSNRKFREDFMDIVDQLG